MDVKLYLLTAETKRYSLTIGALKCAHGLPSEQPQQNAM